MDKRWEKLGEIIPVPGYSDERIHMYLASELSAAQQNLDKDELLNVHQVKLADAIHMIYQGEIIDAKTICALFLTLHRLDRNYGRHDGFD